MIKSVCVYCGSSSQCRSVFTDAAAALGAIFAEAGITIIYGGGRKGLMGALADGALARGGRVIGVIPRFMSELEWGHTGVTELRLVKDMHERKLAMANASDAFVALPGGCGTFEELLEIVTWKRLGMHTKPVVVVNTEGFYDNLKALWEQSVAERFMDHAHLRIWSFVSKVNNVMDALISAPPWDENMRDLAAL